MPEPPPATARSDPSAWLQPRLRRRHRPQRDARDGEACSTPTRPGSTCGRPRSRSSRPTAGCVTSSKGRSERAARSRGRLLGYVVPSVPQGGLVTCHRSRRPWNGSCAATRRRASKSDTLRAAAGLHPRPPRPHRCCAWRQRRGSRFDAHRTSEAASTCWQAVPRDAPRSTACADGRDVACSVVPAALGADRPRRWPRLVGDAGSSAASPPASSLPADRLLRDPDGGARRARPRPASTPASADLRSDVEDDPGDARVLRRRA